jgi:hypothetical protein
MKFNRAISRNAAIALAVCAAFGSAGVMAADTPQASPKFLKMDKNNDGFVTRDEVVGIRWYDRAFDGADENKDGRLDQTEFVKAEAIQDRLAAGHYVSDTALKAKVKAALVMERGLKSRDLDLEVVGGEVLVSGFVRDEGQRSRALRAANSVTGVAAVRDGMIVK